MPNLLIRHNDQVINSCFMEETEIETFVDNLGVHFPEHNIEELAVQVRLTSYSLSVEGSSLTQGFTR